MVFELLIVAAVSVVLFFSLMNVGTFINGTISDSLTDTYPTNTASGLVDVTYYYNGTTSGYRNYSLPCTVGELSPSGLAKFYILANGTKNVIYNLTTNGHATNDTSTLIKGTGYNQTFLGLLFSGNLSTSDTYVNFTFNTNNTYNRIKIGIYGTYYKASDYRTAIENNTYDSLTDLSSGYDSNINILVVAAIIVMITIPLAAIVAVKKLL